MEIKRATIEFKADTADPNNDMGLFEGHGSVFSNIDLGGDVVEPGAFSKSLMKWQEKNELPAMFGFHKYDNPIGDWLEMREDEKGLYVKGQLWVRGDKRIESAVVAHNMMRGTGPKGLSIGYIVKEFEDQEFNGGMVRHIKSVDLMEVSVVGFAMNPLAEVESVKSLAQVEGKNPTKREVEKFLRDAGMSAKQSKAFIAAGFDAAFCDGKGDEEGEARDESMSADILASLKQLSSTIQGK